MSKKSLYAQYMEELDGTEFIEYDWGFLSYRIEQNHVYIEDVYVIKSERGTNKWKKLWQDVEDVARSNGFNKVTGSVVPTRKNSTWMTKFMFKLGFKIYSSDINIIYFVKEIN
jgi:predicted GNAT superfamily acetyltransferase